MKKAFLALAAVALLITSCGGNATGNGTDAQEDVKYQTYGGITSSSGDFTFSFDYESVDSIPLDVTVNGDSAFVKMTVKLTRTDKELKEGAEAKNFYASISGRDEQKDVEFRLDAEEASMEQLKAILGLSAHSTTIFGADWRNDYLMATSGNIDQSAYTLAAYAQHEMRLVKDLTATLGLRLTHHETFNDHLTPKVTLMYAPGSFRFRATYSAGFRAPGLDELYYHYFSVNRGKAQISFGNRDLKPEKSHYFSLNAEYRTQLLAVSITGFLNRINDMVVKQNVPVDDATRMMLMKEFPEMTQDQADKMVSYALYQNSDKGDVKGMQVNVSANIFEGFNLSANYVYTYARTKSGDEWTVLERSMRHAATVAANYHHAWGKYGLNVNLNGRLQSKTYYTGTYEDAPGFGLWNLHTTHTFDCAKWAMLEPSIGIDNLFNKVDRRIDSSTRKYALYSPGRMLVVGLKVKFK